MKWVDVSKKLPDSKSTEFYLVATKSKNWGIRVTNDPTLSVFMARYLDGKWIHDRTAEGKFSEDTEITHWMKINVPSLEKR
jgi:hypothetical protein